MNYRRHYATRLPTPLAQLYHRAYNDDDVLIRLKASYLIFEALLQLVTTTALTVYRLAARQGTRSAAADNELKNLSRPSVGQWVGMMRALAKHHRSCREPAAEPLKDLYRQLDRNRTDLLGMVELYRQIKCDVLHDPFGGKGCTLFNLFDVLPPFRNRKIGHGGVPAAETGPESSSRWATLLFEAANDVLCPDDSSLGEAYHLLGPPGTVLVRLGDLSRASSSEYRISGRELIGPVPTRIEPRLVPADAAAELLPGQVAVWWPAAPAPIALDPLLRCPEITGKRVYFYNGGEEYLDYPTDTRLNGASPALTELLAWTKAGTAQASAGKTAPLAEATAPSLLETVRVFVTFGRSAPDSVGELVQALACDDLDLAWKEPLTPSNVDRASRVAEATAVHVVFWDLSAAGDAVLLRLLRGIILHEDPRQAHRLLLLPIDSTPVPPDLSPSLWRGIQPGDNLLDYVEPIRERIRELTNTIPPDQRPAPESVRDGRIVSEVAPASWQPGDNGQWVFERLRWLQGKLAGLIPGWRVAGDDGLSWSASRRLGAAIQRGLDYFAPIGAAAAFPVAALHASADGERLCEVRHLAARLPRWLLVMGPVGSGHGRFARLILEAALAARRARDTVFAPIVLPLSRLLTTARALEAFSSDDRALLADSRTRRRCWVLVDGRNVGTAAGIASARLALERLTRQEPFDEVGGWVLLSRNGAEAPPAAWERVVLRGVFVEELPEALQRDRLAYFLTRTGARSVTPASALELLATDVTSWETMGGALLAHAENQIPPEAIRSRDLLLRVVWPRVFGQLYSQTARSDPVLDYAALSAIVRNRQTDVDAVLLDPLWSYLEALPDLFEPREGGFAIRPSWFMAGLIASGLSQLRHLEPSWPLRTPFHFSILTELETALSMPQRWKAIPGLVRLAHRPEGEPITRDDLTAHQGDEQEARTVMSSFVGPLLCDRLIDHLGDPVVFSWVQEVEISWRSRWAFERVTRSGVLPETGDALLRLVDPEAMGVLIEWHPNRVFALVQAIERTGRISDHARICDEVARRNPEMLSEDCWRVVQAGRLVHGA